MSNFGVSISKSSDYCVLVQPPFGLSKPAVVYLSNQKTGSSWSCELSEPVLDAHVSDFGIPDSQLKGTDVAPVVFGHKFVTEQMIPAVNAGSYTVDDESSSPSHRIINISYTVNAIPCKGILRLKKEEQSGIVAQILAQELLRCYDKIAEMKDLGKAHGIEFPSDSGPDIATLHKMQVAETRRRQFSAVNPHMRATKKVAKGFGSKAS